MTAIIHVGDALSVLRTLPAESVHCCVTSPPYWGLRNYGVDGQMGLEPTPQAFLAGMVAVFAEVRRVLRSDGVCWVNMGDCYATGAGKVGDCPGGGEQGRRWRDGSKESFRRDGAAVGPRTQPNRMPQDGLKPKDLCGMPWRLAFALQADGWWLRSDCIWHKPNPMPESVTDRPTKAHEYVFLLTKSARYFYDANAVRQPSTGKPSGNVTQNTFAASDPVLGRTRANLHEWEPNGQGANLRTVWTIPTQPYSGAHFATFPEALAERCILAGCPLDGTVLDPFAGSGTTLAVAIGHGRHAIGIELNPKYAEMARKRVDAVAPLFERVEVRAGWTVPT